MIPLLGTDYLSSPMEKGVITSKTADLLASAGNKLAQDIETRSHVDEARMMAPQISDLYGGAYQKIAAGDFTGFADMQKAQALAVGNPILMHTVDQANQLAGTLAGDYTRSQIASSQMDKSQKTEEARIKAAAELQDRYDQRAAAREQGRDSRAAETQARTVWATEHHSWERENFEGQKQSEREMKAWQGEQEAENANAALQGRQPRAIPKPIPYSPKPEPKLEDYMSKIAPTAVSPELPTKGDGPALPGFRANDTPAEGELIGQVPADNIPKATANGAPTAVATAIPAPASPAAPTAKGWQPGMPTRSEQDHVDFMDWNEANDGSGLPGGKAPDAPLVNQNESAALTSPATPTSTPLTDAPVVQHPEPKQGAMIHPGAQVAQLGDIAFVVPKEGPRLKSTKVDSTGKVENNYEYSKDDEEFIKSVNSIQRRFPSLANFAAQAHRSGTDVEFRVASTADLQAAGVTAAKGTEYYIARAGNVALTENAMDYNGQVVRDEKGALHQKPVIFTKNGKDGAVDEWNKAMTMPHGLEITTPEIADPALKDKVRNLAIANLASDPSKLPFANKNLQSYGVAPITPADIEAFVKGQAQKVQAEKDKAHGAQFDARAASELSSEHGIFPPGAKSKPEQRRDWYEAAKKEIDESVWPRMTELRKFFAETDQPKTDAEYQDMKQKQKELTVLSDRLAELHRQLHDNSPSVLGKLFGVDDSSLPIYPGGADGQY